MGGLVESGVLLERGVGQGGKTNKKTKIKIYADSVITNFHNKKMPKEKAP